jgi:hypothetical protein
MKAASVSEIKRELSNLDSDRLQDLTMRLAKYKKENKELLTYLLYESGDEHVYIQSIKGDIDTEFDLLVKEKNLYFLKKSIRRILRLASKQIKYSGIPETEVEVRMHFCTALRNSGIPFQKNPVLVNLYQGQLKKIHQVLEKLPEDLQFDYDAVLKSLKI